LILYYSGKNIRRVAEGTIDGRYQRMML